MSRDQTELRRGGSTPASQASGTNDRPRSSDRAASPVPEDNQPGHHPEHEQDQPDLDAFVARFNGEEPTGAHGTAVGSGGHAALGASGRTSDDVLRDISLPPDHGANAGPVDFSLHGALHLPKVVLRGGVRVAARGFHLAARVSDTLADRLETSGEAR